MNIKAGFGLGAATALLAASAGLTATPVTAAPLPPQATSASSTAAIAGPAIHFMAPIRPASSRPRGGGGISNLTNRGGGVERKPNIILDFWGTQWTSDPSGESSYLTTFLKNLGTGESWSTSTSQYCSGPLAGAALAFACSTNFVGPVNTSAPVIINPTSLAPTHPTQAQLAAEAARVATSTPGWSSDTQVVVATAHGNSASGFGTQYCAWHSSTTTGSGLQVSYTNLPYITDAGPSCGENFVNSGSSAGQAGLLDGVSIVEGHELAETMTDPFPNSGWLDGSGSENGDKCAWVAPFTPGGAGNLTFSGQPYAVQSLWSDTLNNNVGGCVFSYTSSSVQSSTPSH